MSAMAMEPELADEIRQLEIITNEKGPKIQKTLAKLARGMREKAAAAAQARFAKAAEKVH